MPKAKTTKDLPAQLKPFSFHGVEFNEIGDEQATAECPFCGKSKFYVSIEKGLWQCKVCASGSDKGGGNIYTFLNLLWEMGGKNSQGYADFAKQRKLLNADTLVEWGVVKSPLTGEWLVPAFNLEGKLNNLYRYTKMVEKQKDGTWKEWMALQCTAGLKHSLHGYNLFDKDKPEVWVCEGPWDGMAAWEILRSAKTSEDGLMFTGTPSVSLLANINILATPGANVFNADWAKLLPGKKVTFPFDSDHPLTQPSGNTLVPVGFAGVKRNSEILASAEEPPESIHYLDWGPEGYDPDLPDGTDIRDVLAEEPGIQPRLAALANILEAIVPIPQEWLGGRTPEAKAKGKVDLALITCFSWTELIKAWRKAMKWTEGLDRALSVMLASVVSTKAVGDQLWVKIIGPASCGKSTLCEAISSNREYVIAKSTITGFHSGYKTDRDGEDDSSLTAQLYDKTLVTKDGDTLIQSPNLGVILSQARDIYDRNSRTHYGNKMGKDYHGLSMTWILCGTSSLRSLDQSELGERFLDCVIMEGIDDELEDEILIRVANRAEASMSLESGKDQTSHTDAEMTKAIQMTGGFVTHLRQSAKSLLDAVVIPPDAMSKLIRLGKFVAYMRARPSKRQDETAEREFAARLVSQHVRLAKCMGAVLGVKRVDEEVMRRVHRTSFDTARGKTMTIIKCLYGWGREVGADTKTVAMSSHGSEPEERKLLRFLRQIGAVELFKVKAGPGMSARDRWRLTEKMETLYSNVKLEDE